MSFRIGKSVLLNFGTNLEPFYILIGLAFLLIIGPLFRWYVLGMTIRNFKLPRKYFIELAPFIVVFVCSIFADNNWFHENNKKAIIIFGSALIFIYIHLAVYIILSAFRILKIKKSRDGSLQTKSQKSIIKWLGLLTAGFGIIWVTYVLNIVEDLVPYVVGPMMYSAVIYFLSFKAYHLKILNFDGKVFAPNEHRVMFHKIEQLVIVEKRSLEPNFSLSVLSELLGKSSQITSEVINECANQNFNDFINYHRIQEAKVILLSEKGKKFTIASIAYDIGFSSLSSFNNAFKKFQGETPSMYRKNNISLGI